MDTGWPAELCLPSADYTVFTCLVEEPSCPSLPGQESDSHQLTGQSRVSSMPWGHLQEASLQLWQLLQRKELEAAALYLSCLNRGASKDPIFASAKLACNCCRFHQVLTDSIPKRTIVTKGCFPRAQAHPDGQQDSGA